MHVNLSVILCALHISVVIFSVTFACFSSFQTNLTNKNEPLIPQFKCLPSHSMSGKKTVCLFLFSLLLCGGTPLFSSGVYSDKDKTTAETAPVQPASFAKADSLICFAEQLLGKPYRYACADPSTGFDCSGFVSYVFGHGGIRVPRSSRDYEKLGREVSMDSCRAGDIIVFTGTNASIRHAGHVGIVISAQGQPLTFIQSSSSKKQNGVIISAYNDSPYYSRRFIKIVRVLE
jgi:lipoprotein Spr